MIKALLALLSLAKFGKAGTTLGTMLLSVGVYALQYGWAYAAGLVGLIFCHEMGHFLAARQRGLDVGAPTFIPFVGAWIQLKNLPHDVETEAYVGIAGPVVGTAAALACYFAAGAYRSPFLLSLAYSGLLLNLFNLLPISPLDGGRITAILSPRIWLLGVPMLVAVFLWRPSMLLLLVALFALPQVVAAWRGDFASQRPAGYYEVPLAKRAEYACWYLGLAALLAVLCYEVHGELSQR
ncbi:MAG: site-2 protease family protein [Gammaproteobacteria bacterium]|nr:site-2 protease family protein [Gammaproteobacteria bacterium]